MAEQLGKRAQAMCPNAAAARDDQSSDVAEPRNRWIENCSQPERIGMLLRDFGVSRRLREQRIDERLIPKACTHWLHKAADGGSMILAGPPGSGKTTVAVWCLRALCLNRIRQGIGAPRAKYLKARELYHAVFRRDIAVIGEAEKAHVLVLDDWGAAYEHAWPLSELEGIIDRRWEERLPTIVTTNMNPHGGEHSLSELLPRSYDRLTGEPGPGVVIIDRRSLRQRRVMPEFAGEAELGSAAVSDDGEGGVKSLQPEGTSTAGGGDGEMGTGSNTFPRKGF